MFGGGAPQEDMFAKLDQMREIITEVNTQFKDPVKYSFNACDGGADNDRKRRHSFASAFQSFCRYTKLND